MEFTDAWTPISLADLYDRIHRHEANLVGPVWNFWCAIQIDPVKWGLPPYGDLGGGFWVVAICGRFVIWYNDIEDGFNVSTYTRPGDIAEYWCNQDHIDVAVLSLYNMAVNGYGLAGRAGPPHGPVAGI